MKNKQTQSTGLSDCCKAEVIRSSGHEIFSIPYCIKCDKACDLWSGDEADEISTTTSIPLSACHKAEMTVVGSGGGTMYYECNSCHSPCDMWSSTTQETSKQMEDWEKRLRKEIKTWYLGYEEEAPNDYLISKIMDLFISQKQEILDRMEEWIKVDVGAIPKTNDYANGWNECRHEVYDKIQEPLLSQLKKIREEI